MSIYSIASQHINIELDAGDLDESWGKFFAIPNDSQNEFEQVLFKCSTILIENINRDFGYIRVGSCGNVFMSYEKTMLVNDSYSLAYIQKANKKIYNTFLNLLFYTHVIQKQILQLHCSIIEFMGKGVIFLGASGVGKTTQAECWAKYQGAMIINGDIGLVQKTDQGFVAWGTPWHGSSPYCENTSVPVKALVVLKQAPENSIRELTGFEKVTAVSNSVFYPQWLENGMELCLETLDHLLSALPVYELSCRPDEEAVQLTEEAVFGRG